jgi:DNA-binding transcriptional LysR family regulator
MRLAHVSSGMDLRQLEIIRAIADTGSFTAAGEKLHVSQSAISRQVLLLEDELGEPVFHRVGRRVRITPAGESLLQLSHRVFQDLQDTISGITDRQESLKGTLRLVGGMTVCLYVFPALLTEIRKHHPLLDLKITAASTERCVALLRAGTADLGLLTLPIDVPDLVAVPVLQEELLVVGQSKHPLARKRTIEPADLAHEHFVLFESGSNTRRAVDEFFVREKIEPRIVMETENVEILKAMVKTGVGITIIPYQAVASEIAARRMFARRIRGHEMIRETGWIYPKTSRLPRSVSEVLTAFERIQPKLRTSHP